MDFQTQMQLVKERNQMKYENRLMIEEDNYSKISQELFNMQRLKEKQEQIEKERLRIEQIELAKIAQIQKQFLEEEERKEKKNMDDFVKKYVINKLNRNRGVVELNIETIRLEAINAYYDRKLIEQQDEEYARACSIDINNFK